jgi:uncharacterized membrane protein
MKSVHNRSIINTGALQAEAGGWRKQVHRGFIFLTGEGCLLMITSGFAYLAVMVFFAGAVVWAERASKSAFFKYLPAVVLIYLGAMLLSTADLWQKTEEISSCYQTAKTSLLPVMIFLMLLRCDLRNIIRLGPRMLLGFFTASLSIVLGFVIVYVAFKGVYEPDTWKAFAALAGSWIGGTGNMLAVQEALGVPPARMGSVLLMDSINYGVWVMILLALTPLAPVFNAWTGSDTAQLRRIGMQLNETKHRTSRPVEFPDLIFLLGTGLLVSALSMYLAERMPATDFITASAWTVIMVTAAGIVSAMTPLARIPGSSQLSSLALYILIGLIGSQADFAGLTRAPLYIISGFLILGVHALALILAAKVFKLDLFTCAVASLANIGGVASAPILAASYSEALIPIGVLMALMGYVVGTAGGLLVGKILSLL